jgi:hypothetical protein
MSEFNAHTPDLKPLWKFTKMEINSHVEFHNNINISGTNALCTVRQETCNLKFRNKFHTVDYILLN